MSDHGWLVVNIGCIECGVSSNVVGLYAVEEEAKAIAAELDKTHGWSEGGQNSYEVFACPEIGAPIPDEYQAKEPES